MTKETKISFIVSTLFYSLCGIIIYFFVKFLFVYLFPAIIGLIITISVQRPAGYLSDKLSVKKGNCALFLVICVYLFLLGICSLIIYLIGSSLLEGGFINEINRLYLLTNEFVETVLNSLPMSVKKALIDSTSGLLQGVTKLAGEVASGLPMFLTGSIVTILASCYIAKDYDGFKDGFIEVLDYKYIKIIDKITFILKNNFLKILVGYMKLMLITFLELYIGLLLLRIKRALLLAVIISILDLLPIIGTGTILIPWGLYNLVTGDVYLGIALLILYVIVAILRSTLEPRIIGKQIGLHPLIAVLAVFTGLKIGGFLGMITVPLLLMLVIQLYKERVFTLLKK